MSYGKTYTFSIYGSGSVPNPTKKELAADTDPNTTFQFTNQEGDILPLMTLWKSQQVNVSETTEVGMGLLNERASEVAANESITPTRLWDCEEGKIKGEKEILQETGGKPPVYLIISHVWGKISEQLEISNVPWKVPISSKKKWDNILAFCKANKTKWMWMDIICINQTRGDPLAQVDKTTEMGRMSQYYGEASQCLVVPDCEDAFTDLYKRQVDIYDTIIAPKASVSENAEKIWENIAHLDKCVMDTWFWRIWTYQELILPKNLILSDAKELNVKLVAEVVDWYYKILRTGELQKPAKKQDYDYIQPGQEMVILHPWWIPCESWALKADFDKNGYLDLATAVNATRNKDTSLAADRIFGLYGLLQDADKVEVEYLQGLPKALWDAVLSVKWKETAIKVAESGRIWPLLMDAMETYDTKNGQIWIPRITAPELSYGIIDPTTIPYKNSRKVAMGDKGLELSIKNVGSIVGASTSIGDGSGEVNKLLVCAWALVAKGFDTVYLVDLLKNALAKSHTVKPDELESLKKSLEEALNSDTIEDCFKKLWQLKLPNKLLYGIPGWNKSVICVDLKKDKPAVFLSWIHHTMQPHKGESVVMDVATEPAGDERRCLIVNKSGDTWTRIGSVTVPVSGEGSSFVNVILN